MAKFIGIDVQAWLASTARLSYEQQGIYWTITAMLYERDGYIPVEDLPTLLNIDVDLCNRNTNAIQTHCGLYTTEYNGVNCWTHDKVLSTLKSIQNKSEKARLSAQRRWNKKEKCERNAKAMRKQCEGNAKKNEKRKMKNEEPLTPLQGDCKKLFDCFFNYYSKHANGNNGGNIKNAMRQYKNSILLIKPEELYKAMTDYLQYCQNTNTISKHASSWLSSHGWNDVYLTKNKETNLAKETNPANESQICICKLSEQPTAEQWERTLARMRYQLGHSIFNTWLKFIYVKDKKILCPKSHEKMTSDFYKKIILKLLQQENKKIVEVL